MDQEAVRRAHERLQAAREGRLEQADVNATLERASAQLEALAQAAAQLEATVPTQVQTAVENGLREQVRPVGKNLAELRGLTNQLLRRLEAIEGGALAERHARVDDLALLVDLITSGWHGVDERLARIERALEQRSGAVVYRLEDHLQEPAGSGR
jgi:vacuolar-type H+-ATPase subunit E/Vma4